MRSPKDVPAIRFAEFEGEWEERALGDVFEERDEPGNESLGILSVSIHSGVSDHELDDLSLGKKVKRSEDKSLYKQVHPGDLVFNMMRAWQGAAGVTRVQGMVSPAYITAAPIEDISAEFMNQAIQREAVVKQMNDLSYGVTDFRKRLYWDSFVQMQMSFPSPTEQAKIGSLFENLDSLIRLQRSKLKKLRQIKSAMLSKMFPKPDAKVPEVRFPGFEGEWVELELAAIADIAGGGTPSTAIASHWGGDVDWYTPAEIGKSAYADGSVRQITAEGLRSSSAVMLPAKRTVLFTSRAGIGNMAILRKPGCTNQGFQSLVVSSANNPYFVLSMGHLIKSRAQSVASGSTFLEVSGRTLGQLSFLFPSGPEQAKIGEFFEQLDALIDLQVKKNEKLDQIKRSLLSKMFV